MTLKHIDFFDSPVMMELERLAIKNGTAKPLSMDEIVKNASAAIQDEYKPTGDLFLDVARLADGLRAKGYIKEAYAVESKLTAYKQAAKEFSDILDEAHPEGDVTMGEASSELGDVETLESAHLKIEEILKKVPTGKQASVESLLAKTAKILNAQAVPTASSDPFANDFGNDRNTAHAAQVNAINAIVDKTAADSQELFANANHMLQVAGAAKFNVGSLLTLANQELVTVYSKYAGKDPATVLNFIQRYRNIFGAVKPSVQVVYDRVDSLEGDQLKAYAKLFGDQFANQIPSDSDAAPKDNVDTLVSVMNFEVSNVVKSLMDRSDKKALATQMYQSITNEFNEYLGQDSIDAASQALHTALTTNVINKLAAIATAVSSIQKLPPDANTNVTVRSAYEQQIAEATKFTADLTVISTLSELTKTFSLGSTVIEFVSTAVIPALKQAYESVMAQPIAAGDQGVSVEQITAIRNTFVDAGQKMINYVQANGGTTGQAAIENGPQMARIRSVVDVLNTALKDRQTKPFAQLFEGIRAALPNAVSLESLQETAAKWNKAITEYVSKKASSVDQLLKTAVPVDLDGGATVPASTKSPAPANGQPSKPGAAPVQARRLTTISDDEKKAVKEMQDLLARIAQHVQDPSVKSNLTTVGKGGANGSDGAWLGYTSRGLQTAQGLIDAEEKKTGKSIGKLQTAQMGGTSGAIPSAQANSKILRQYLVSAWKDDAGGAATAEGVPSGLPAEYQSLLSYFNYLISSGGAKEETAPTTVSKDPSGREYERGGQTGIDATTFWMKLGELHNYYKSEVSPPRPEIAKYLYGLYKELVAIVDRFGLSPEGPNGNIVTKEMLATAAPSASGSGGAGGGAGPSGAPGQNGADGAAYRARRQRGDSGDGSDLEIGAVEDYPEPILLRGANKGDIDLKTEYYGALRASFPGIPLFFPFQVFRANSAQDFAKALFHDTPNTPGVNGPNYFQTMQRFLNALSESITRAVAAWEDYADPTMAERGEMYRHMMRWQKVIQQKMQQLGASVR